MLLLQPQNPDRRFDEQVMFLAHACPFYNYDDYPRKLLKLLHEKYAVLHPATRKVLVQALILLRNRNQYELIEALPLHFRLLALDDKQIRTQVHTHIVRDVLRMNQNNQNQIENRRLQAYLFQQLGGNGTTSAASKSGKKDGGAANKNESLAAPTLLLEDSNVAVNETQAARKALIILISLYKKNIWTGAAVVNAIAGCCEHPDTHVAKAAVNFLLGNTHLIAEEENDSEDEENKKAVGDVSKKVLIFIVLGLKRFTKGSQKKKKIEKAKKKAAKAMSKKDNPKSGLENKTCFAAIDLLHDPQKLAERLLLRVMRASETYAFRLLLLQLCSRLMGRHRLVVPNFYPYIQKYLTPTQREVTTVLACLAQSCHDALPVETVRPAVVHLLHTFVNETNAPEVITVGINSLREIACRVPLALEEEEVHDLCGFRKYKHKGVRVGVKSIVNMYRELNPALLQRQFRGKDAAEALARGEFDSSKQEGGITTATLFGQGLELLAARNLRKAEKKEEKRRAKEEGSDASDSDSDDEEEDENASGDAEGSDVGDEEEGSDLEEEVSDIEEEEEASDLEEDDEEEEESDVEEPEAQKKGGDKGAGSDSDLDLEDCSAPTKKAKAVPQETCPLKRKKASTNASPTEKKEANKSAKANKSEVDGSDADKSSSDGNAEDVDDDSDEENSDVDNSDSDASSASDDEGGETNRISKRNLAQESKDRRKRRKLAEQREQAAAEKERRDKIESAAREMFTERVLGPEDFKKMRELQAKKALELQSGRGRRAAGADSDEDSLTDSSDSDKSDEDKGDENSEDKSEDDDDDSDMDEEERKQKELKKANKRVYNDIDFIDPSKLSGFTRKKHDKHTRLQSVKKGREGREKFGGGKSGRTGGSTNKEKRRNKPMLMQIQSRSVRTKRNGQKATAKLANLRKHIGNLKKGGKNQKRRR
ncbi:unnamed protein product [Amoebophrya sp. A25]|nr:unnamed protein product [Amoebophrya sp. A25]|eukprot:GSA25T00011409001.1